MLRLLDPSVQAPLVVVVQDRDRLLQDDGPVVDLLIEKDDLVVSNWTVRGTHTGTPFYGVAASGEAVEINGTAILRIRDGKIVEHWGGPHCQDGVGLTH